MNGNSIQAQIAYNNFKSLDRKNQILDEIRLMYNDKLNYNNTSRHLYRIRVKNNKEFVSDMKHKGIQCGIHYKACHNNPIFANRHKCNSLPLSDKEEQQTVSIPFHERMISWEIDRVIENVKRTQQM